MILRIQLFAGVAEAAGRSEVTLETDGPVTAEGLKRLLAERFPQAAYVLAPSFVARNQAYAAPDTVLAETDELAVIPPVSGGEEASTNSKSDREPYYRLTREPIEADAVTRRVLHRDHGASLVFVGTTREHTHGRRTVRLEYDAYEPMALASLAQIGREIADRWPRTLCAITHRLGTVGAGEASVAIAVSSPHRPACYEASRYALERLKQIVPIWKKEIWEDGAEWVGHQLGPWDPTAPPKAAAEGEA